MKKYVLALAFIGMTAFSVAHANIMSSETKKTADALGAATVAEVKFTAGQASLTQDEIDHISAAIANARATGTIDEVKVITWADREYPAKNTSASDNSVRLADSRGEYLKKYLKAELNVDTVRTFNMAKRTNALQDFLNTPTARLKQSLEATGAAPVTSEDTGLFGLKAKASSGVVLVYLK